MDESTTWGVPVAFVDAIGLQAGQRGITTHAQVTAAFHKSTHTDPGPSFPMNAFLAFVQAELPPAAA